MGTGVIRWRHLIKDALLTCLAVAVVVVVAEVVLGGDVDVLCQHVGQPAAGRPAAPAAGGGGGGGRRGGRGGGGGGGGAVDRPADPVLHADAPFPAGRGAASASAAASTASVLVLAVTSAFFFVAVPLALTL